MVPNSVNIAVEIAAILLAVFIIALRREVMT